MVRTLCNNICTFENDAYLLSVVDVDVCVSDGRVYVARQRFGPCLEVLVGDERTDNTEPATHHHLAYIVRLKRFSSQFSVISMIGN